jgi:hypothetical protein
MASGVTVTKDGMAGLNKSLAQLIKSRVLVGVPAETAEREPEPGEEAKPINNAAIAYIMNAGSPAQNIPARPFMEPGIEAVEDRIAAAYKKGAQQLLDNPSADPNETHMKVGLIAQTSIQDKITDGPFTPLAPSTIAARQAAGRTRTTPLIDTGQLRRAITYVIRKKS